MSLHTLFDTAKDQRRATLLGIGVIILNLLVLIALLSAPTPHAAQLANLYYLAASTGIGFWLYISNPPLYLGFVWWLWFLSPFIRRLADYQLGEFTHPKEALILLTPFVVTSLCIITVFRRGRALIQLRTLPFFMCILGVLYGFLVGLPLIGPFDASISLLEWITPLLLAFHMAAMWRQFPKHRRIIRTTFIGGAFVLGTYALIQFFVMPEWDRLWMIGSKMNSIGQPEPFEVRVFSMLNAPGPLATTLIPGLLLLFESRTLMGKLTAIPGYVGFLLSLVRSAWGAWMLGMLYLVWRLSGRLRVRLLALTVVMAIAVLPVAMMGEISQVTGERVETIGSIGDDGSLDARERMYRTATIDALVNPLGEGLGSDIFDSGFVTILWQLGWVGGSLYLGGLLWLLWSVVLSPRAVLPDQFTIILAAVVLGYFANLSFGTVHVEIAGCVMWSFLGLIVASRRYHSAVPTAETEGAPEPAADSATEPSSASPVPA
ncbi:MAG: hypothetical protein ACLFTE_06375 [Salinivenus sp.]